MSLTSFSNWAKDTIWPWFKFSGVGSVKVLKIEEMLEVQDVDEQIFGDSQDNQKTQSDEQGSKGQNSNHSEEDEESEDEYRQRTGQEPWTSHVTWSHQGPESYTCLHGFTSFQLSFLSCDPRAFSLLEYQASPSHVVFDTTVVKVNLEMTEKVVPNTFSSFWSYVVKYIHLCIWANTFVHPSAEFH